MYADISEPASCDIFFRIPKTASYTLRNLVTREYGKKACLDTDFPLLNPEVWRHFMQDTAAMPVEKRSQYRTILGHMKFGVHELVPGSARYITFLRDPVKRFASYYYMLRQIGIVALNHHFDPERPDWNMPNHESFHRELDNGQTRALANTDFELPFGQCNEDHLQAAKDNIDKHFAFVGLTEHFDLSLMLLKRICGWRWHFYVAKNVTPPSAVTPRLTPPMLQAISRLNRLDYQLYDYARERFWETVRSYGPVLQWEHRAFVACNTVHHGFHHVYYPLKQLLRGPGKKQKNGMTTLVSDTVH